MQLEIDVLLGPGGKDQLLTKTTYAISTTGADGKEIPVPEVEQKVEKFLDFARANEEVSFHIRAINNGGEVFTDEVLAGMFDKAPDNCGFPRSWGQWTNA